MSILIKGIELPERVQVLELHPDGKVFTRKGYLVGEAVALPDKHGRLVDADSFKEHLIACAENGRPLHRMYTELDELIEAVDNMPTIVEAEDSECRKN